MLFILLFGGVGILMWVAAGVLLFNMRKQLRKTALMGRVETSPTAGIPGILVGTPVEVKGILRCEEPPQSEMAGRECAYYLSRVLREYYVTTTDSDGDSHRSRRSEEMVSNEQFAPFAVEDDSGVVGIRGEGAEVDALEVMNRFENETGGTFTLGGVTVQLGGGQRTIGYRYVEGVLPLDTPVYVLGTVREGGQMGPPLTETGETVPDQPPLRGATGEKIQEVGTTARLPRRRTVPVRDFLRRHRHPRRSRNHGFDGHYRTLSDGRGLPAPSVGWRYECGRRDG